MNGISKRVSGSWVSGDERVMKTATDTITTLPADLYADGTATTIGLKGNMSQTGTPTPQNPIQPQETGERTGNLFDGIYSVGILSVSGNEVIYLTSSSGRVTFIECKPNTTYTVKKHETSNRFLIAESATQPQVNDHLSIVINNISLTEYTFTTADTTHYMAVYVSTSSEAAEPKMTVTEGSTAPSSFIPYGIKIPISSANTTTPVYLGEVQSTRQIFKVVFDGTENWTEYGSGSSRFFYTSLSTQGYNDSKLVMSTHFQYTAGSSAAYSISLASNGTMLRIYDRETNWADATTFKSWLAAQYSAGTPVTVWYVLATPTTGIVNEPLRKIGDYADTVSGISIPTISGADSFDVQTTLKPSEVTANYHGWHTGAVHERESGQWD